MGYEILALALTAVAGYLLGSINSSIILTWFFKNKEDIRKYGSGNAGMTNVLRSVGKLPAAWGTSSRCTMGSGAAKAWSPPPR